MKILMSACLMGERVRYNGSALEWESPWLQRLLQEVRVHTFCPELAAGMPIPRPCAEICGGTGHDVLAGKAEVRDAQGRVVSGEFLQGALKALDFCRENTIVLAVLTENSPSCGSEYIYDGTFTGKQIKGCGITTALLVQNGIRVFSQNEIEEAVNCILELKENRS